MARKRLPKDRPTPAVSTDEASPDNSLPAGDLSLTVESSSGAPPVRAGEVSDTLGKLCDRILRLRQQRGLSLEELARRSGISASSLSQLERGLGNPSFITLTKLAAALHIPIGTLFGEEPEAANGIVRRDKRKRLMPANQDLVYQLVTPDLNRALEVVLIDLPAGTTEVDSPFQHEGEECVLVLEGQMRFHLGNEEHTLGNGDSITFSGRFPHWASNPGPGNTRLIVIITPPAF